MINMNCSPGIGPGASVGAGPLPEIKNITNFSLFQSELMFDVYYLLFSG